MALEAVVFQQDPYSYGVGFEDKAYCNGETVVKRRGFGFSSTWDSNSSSSPDNGFAAGGFSPTEEPPPARAAPPCRRKRRRNNGVKNREEMENQRMTHIAVERNRRKQMNDYLAVLKSMMPTPYVQRGDQASIVGGAINFVKELEQLLQSLEARKRIEKISENSTLSSLFSAFFYFPQYSATSTNITHLNCAAAGGESLAEKNKKKKNRQSSYPANVEVTMVESHANLKILSEKHPKQLLKMVTGLHSLGLLVLHLNVTSAENLVLYSFSVKVEDNCQLTTVNEIAAAVYEMVDRFQEEAYG